MPATKNVFVKTFGCQMNVYDSERIAEALGAHGYVETSAIEAADLVVLNTCHIREKAVEKVYSDLGKVRDVKAERLSRGLSTQVVVAGCVAQAEGAEISARAPVVDVVIGSQSYHRLPELLIQARGDGRRVVETRFPEEEKFALLPERTVATGSIAKGGAPRIAAQASAFLTVQEGCDKFCTFCVVPYTRGAEYSRSVGELVAETERLVMRGVREITLLGQNVNGYHGEGPGGDSWSLARLIRHLAGIEGVDRLRYMTNHPRDMADDLIAAHRDEPKLMPFLHLPVQSGSDRILAAMNRKHTAKDYLALLDRIRTVRPDIAVSTDIIVGFPGETDKDFAATLELIRTVEFAQAYSFKYSPRPGTPAAKLEPQVPEKLKSERLLELQALLDGQQTRFNASCVGRTLPVLFERKGRHEGQLVGRSPYLQLVHADAEADLLGRIIPVEIAAAGQNSLAGVISAA
ncbi:MAG: tRNA (N6-isopentenyl adenosine(37)-C2)-methylthiotransferase MiaB [Hyphomicrobium sp.]